ncbi:hypothetical protein [Microcoleus sp. CAWBG58]|uniref:hypothetical protein n=1 Tax=Microcoleus sp. CAWBG58 TaxID=2841651 RepID=UPI0025FF95D8|nr:hypothetical protein [Microcoleus sp. CAWBG58]
MCLLLCVGGFYKKELVESPPAGAGEIKIRLFITRILGLFGRCRSQTVNCQAVNCQLLKISLERDIIGRVARIFSKIQYFVSSRGWLESR